MRLATAVLSTGAALMLTGCGDGNIAFGEDPANLAGEWSADLGQGSTLEMVLAADGSATASDWPLSLHCERRDMTVEEMLATSQNEPTVEQVRLSPRETLTGSWSADVDDRSAYVNIRWDQCTSGGALLLIWRAGGDLQLCLITSNGTDPDSATQENTLVFRQEPGEVGCDV